MRCRRMTVNKVCGSGLKALHLGAQAIRCGDADVVIAGGMESMSLAPYVLPGARTGLRMGHAQMVDTMISDGLWDAFNDYHMGITAENLVDKYGISREHQDAFAAASQQKAAAAIEAGRFVDEITPILIPQRKGDRWRSWSTNNRAATPPPNPWRSCVRHSRRTAPSPPATPRRSTTAPPRCC